MGVQGIREGFRVRRRGSSHAHVWLSNISFCNMAKIERYIIDKILDTADIVDVVGDFVTLKKKGVRYTGLCPFHKDRHDGNFIVHPVKQCYKCFTCGAKGGVVDFLMNHEKLSYPDAIRYLGKKYNIETDMNDFNYTPPPPRPKPEPLPTLELPKHIMADTLLNVEKSTLVRWIRTGINWDYAQRKRIDGVLNEYAVGCSKQGMTVFWQMDEKGWLRTGKMMRYREDGHRDKSQGYNFDWIHSALSRTKKIYDQEGNIVSEGPLPHPDLFDPEKQEVKPTFFGMHLLNHYPHAEIHLVESEKTAILMAIAYGNHQRQLWIACGGLEMLTRERLQPIIDRRLRVVLYPDRDGIDKWKIKAEQLHYERLSVNDEPVTKWWTEADGPKADIADVVVRMVNNSKPLTTIAEVTKEMPQAKPLIDKLNLEINNDEQRTEASD